MDGIKNLTKLPPPREPGVQRTEGARTAVPAGTAPAPREAAERVTLTEAARSLLQLRGAGADAAPVDPARVEALRAAIADGTYEIDAERIAERLIALDNNR